MKLWTIGVAASLAAVSSFTEAHHSIAGVYDSARETTVDGIVARFHFVSPHPLVELKDARQIGNRGSGIRDQGSGNRDQGSGIRDQGSGNRDQGSGIRDQGSGIRNWHLEMDNRGELAAIGFASDTLKPGDRIIVTGSLARRETNRMYVRILTRPADGFTYEQVGATPRLRSGPSAR
jgi:hypothetical protein